MSRIDTCDWLTQLEGMLDILRQKSVELETHIETVKREITAFKKYLKEQE